MQKIKLDIACAEFYLKLRQMSGCYKKWNFASMDKKPFAES